MVVRGSCFEGGGGGGVVRGSCFEGESVRPCAKGGLHHFSRNFHFFLYLS